MGNRCCMKTLPGESEYIQTEKCKENKEYKINREMDEKDGINDNNENEGYNDEKFGTYKNNENQLNKVEIDNKTSHMFKGNNKNHINQDINRYDDNNENINIPDLKRDVISSIKNNDLFKNLNNIQIQEISEEEFDSKLRTIKGIDLILSENQKNIKKKEEKEELHKINPLLIITKNEDKLEKDYFSCFVNKFANFTGYGTLITNEGNLYRGNFENNKFNGSGIFIKKNGDYYIGDWLDGEGNGNGKLVMEDGTIFEGEFKKNMKFGKGKEICPDGSEYTGFYINNLREGKGTLKYKDGNYYTGDFSQGLLQGNGEYHWNEGNVYKGQFENNLMHGKGETTWNDGSIYNGYYFNGKKQGNGTYTWNDGRKFIGNWLNDSPNGTGNFEEGGNKYIVIFRFGKIISMKNLPNN